FMATYHELPGADGGRLVSVVKGGPDVVLERCGSVYPADGPAPIAAQRQAVLAKGITVAFYNTFFGLSIAVFCAITFIIINGRQSLLLEDIENALNRIRERIVDRNKAMRTARAA
ncbi:MAG: MotA/TolQ/ExbB proton channel family protein, partial [Ilumatobacter sp.]|nr:MotA/TolQ/ExbB proton channel family protein [Ilumatobacter sp.]